MRVRRGQGVRACRNGLAAKEIGRETVQYVANIFKYYLSYRMVTMQALKRQAAREAAGIEELPKGEASN